MALEIERKFLVAEGFKPSATIFFRISQGYLNSSPERTVRVRIKGDKGFLTIKGLSSENGVSRYEWEKEIPVSEAADLLRLCEPGIIDKTRYIIEAESVEGVVVKVNDVDYAPVAADGYYYVDVPVAANQFGTVYNAYFGDNTAYSVNYSVNHYIATKQPTAGAKLGALLEALYNYGASAVAYNK